MKSQPGAIPPVRSNTSSQEQIPPARSNNSSQKGHFSGRNGSFHTLEEKMVGQETGNNELNH